MADIFETQPLTLQSICDGEMSREFEDLQKEVFRSFCDEHATGSRKITLTISYKPEGDSVKVSYEAKVKIERTPRAGACTALRVGFETYGVHKAKQSDMFKPLKTVGKEN